jgi:hypothetical protein
LRLPLREAVKHDGKGRWRACRQDEEGCSIHPKDSSTTEPTELLSIEELQRLLPHDQHIRLTQEKKECAHPIFVKCNDRYSLWKGSTTIS